MVGTKNGVISKLTGDLLRAGRCDMLNDGAFNPVTEDYRTDVPNPCYCKGQVGEHRLTRWNGSEWVEASQ